jgi:RHS repeat-associated protein
VVFLLARLPVVAAPADVVDVCETVDSWAALFGQTLDPSTGLMHYNARYYDPTIGRFISADTIVPNPADPQQLNRYSYVTNNPVRYTDPTGHCRLGVLGTGPKAEGFGGQPCWWYAEGADSDPALVRVGSPFNIVNGQGDFRDSAEMMSLVPGVDTFADAALCQDSVDSGAIGGSIVDCGSALIPFVGAGMLRKAGRWLGNLFGGGKQAARAAIKASDLTSSGAGRNLVRRYSDSGLTIDINSGHAYVPNHSVQSADITSVLTRDQVDVALATDLANRVDSGVPIGTPGNASIFTVNVDGFDVAYSAVDLANNRYAIGTYYIP